MNAGSRGGTGQLRLSGGSKIPPAAAPDKGFFPTSWLVAGLIVCLIHGPIGCTSRARDNQAAHAQPPASAQPPARPKDKAEAVPSPTPHGEIGRSAARADEASKPKPQGPAVSAAQKTAHDQSADAPATFKPVLPAAPAADAAKKPAAAVPNDRPKVTVEALAGEPFGVGRIVVEFPGKTGPKWFPDQSFGIRQEARRALYPAFATQYAIAADGSDWQVREFTCYFLFRGDRPFRARIAADRTYDAMVQPAAGEERRTALVGEWWRHYKLRTKAFAEDYDEPQVVHQYLTSMLKRRLRPTDSVQASGGTSLPAELVVALVRGLWRHLMPAQAAPPPTSPGRAGASDLSIVRRLGTGRFDRDFGSFVGILFGTESIRIAMQTRRTLSDSATLEVADQPLPEPLAPLPVNVPFVAQAAEIEAIAGHVPEECFYLRCGTVADYFWLRNLMMSWGGSYDHLISMQAQDYQTRPRLERQLALPSDQQFRQELEAHISDMALVGTDIFFHEGAAIGVLLEASDSQNLEALIRRQREGALRQSPQAVDREVEFGQRRASLLSTPDNVVRSFYAIDGNYHLVTTSSYLVQRFFEAGQGRRSLANLREFQYAREKIPLAREDAIFIYLSDPFFRMLVGPHYRVEMTRRMRAFDDLQWVELARLAAKAEGVEARSLGELMRSGLLPATFLDRCDGSRPILQQGAAVDSLRGAPACFMPVPDVPLGKATRAEVASYQEFANYYRTQWRRMDPVIVGISRRTAAEKGRQRVIVDVRVTPYAREHYETLFMALDAPERMRLAPVAGDLMSVEANVRNLSLFARTAPISRGFLFAGLRDFAPKYAIKDGKVETVPLSAWKLLGEDYPAYVGVKTAQRPRATGSFDGHFGPDDEEGYSQSQGAMVALLNWRRQWNSHWTAWAHRKDILAAVTPGVVLEEAERPAQIRFRLGDLSRAKIAPALEAICYVHARRISATNAMLMDQLVQQLGVEPEDARATAERLLGAKLVCPVGGDYRLVKEGAARPHWSGTAWSKESLYEETAVPKSYRFGFLDWLHEAEFDLSLDATTLSAHAELDVKSPPEGEAGSLPLAAPRRKPAGEPRRAGYWPPEEPGPQPVSGQAGSGSVLLAVEVPEDAKVFINGRPTVSTGSQRRYASYGLRPGWSYDYAFRVLMTSEGRTVEQSKTVSVQAGQTARLVFTPEAAASSEIGLKADGVER